MKEERYFTVDMLLLILLQDQRRCFIASKNSLNLMGTGNLQSPEIPPLRIRAECFMEVIVP